MDCRPSYVSYADTGYFSKIIIDYISGSEVLSQFYLHKPDKKGIEAAVAARRGFATDRQLLHEALKKQYEALPVSASVNANIDKLLDENCFTIVTAHQPAIFTGPLYFIYKILHTVKLAAELNKERKGEHFVPVFYMGSEDADLEELGKFFLGADKIVWGTNQKGAVGRMHTKGLEQLITRIEGELSIHPHGPALVQLLRESYAPGANIQDSTLRFLHAIFERFGLVVLVPDSGILKKSMIAVFEDELFNQQSSGIVQQTIEKLSANYKVQASPREINLFYLKDDIRERIEKKEDKWKVVNQEIEFTAEEIKAELSDDPERFSPNVILRGLFQETILPNVAFIGGGGELAYWLELKDLFAFYKTPYPILILRNSFLLLEEKWKERIQKLALQPIDFFKGADAILTSVVKRNSNGSLQLNAELGEVEQLYRALREKAEKIDKTLTRHIEALEVKATRPLKELEKKMLRAEKRKYEDQSRQIQAVRKALFPNDSLQERIESFMPYYAVYGPGLLDCILKNSPSLNGDFVILETGNS